MIGSQARFERVALDAAQWGRMLSGFADRIPHQTPACLAFLAESQRGEPAQGALRDGNQTLGYFTGLIVRKFRLKVLGSPFRGWSTPYLGFNLRPDVPRRLAVAALPDFVFRQLGCIHVEVTDSHTGPEDVRGLGFHCEVHATVINDLAQSEEALLRNMNSYRRRDIRRAEKHGVTIEEARDGGFADEFAGSTRA
jgi:hypothetical protein